MGHGIFPNYGKQFVKSWQHQLSRKEMKDVFYTSKKELRAAKLKEEEEEDSLKIKKKKQNKK